MPLIRSTSERLWKAIERFVSSDRGEFKWLARLGGFNEWAKFFVSYALFFVGLVCLFVLWYYVRIHRTCHYDCDKDLGLTLPLIMCLWRVFIASTFNTIVFSSPFHPSIHTHTLTQINLWSHFKKIWNKKQHLMYIGFQHTFAFYSFFLSFNIHSFGICIQSI